MMAHTKTNKKPISRDYAVTSDDDPSKNQHPSTKPEETYSFFWEDKFLIRSIFTMLF